MATIKIRGSDGREVDFARGGIGERIDMLGYHKLGTVFDERSDEIFKRVRDEWVRIARSRLPTKRAERYVEGISAADESGDPTKIGWSLKGFDAISLEFGWAPPPGGPTANKYRSDGIGEYDGAVHDMRSYMLSTTAKKVKTSKGSGDGDNAGKRYLLVPFKENATSLELADKGLQENLSRKQAGAWKGRTEDDLKKAFGVFGAQLGALKPEGQLDSNATEGLPVWQRKIRSRKGTEAYGRKGGAIVVPPLGGEENIERLTSKHRYSKYHNIIRNNPDKVSGSIIRRRGGESTELNTAGKARGKHAHRFTMIRTINEDLSNRSWMTVGYPPANILADVRRYVSMVISDMMTEAKGTP